MRLAQKETSVSVIGQHFQARAALLIARNILFVLFLGLYNHFLLFVLDHARYCTS